jgi:hypothetical protein
MIEVLKQALDALENIMLMRDLDSATTIAKNARYGLREAIEQAERQETNQVTLTQTNIGIGERGMQAYEEAKKRGWVGLSDERLMEMPKQEALPCCGYRDASAVKWNSFNNVVQCHNCGQTYTPPQRTWVGLTEDDKVLIKHDANFNQFMTAGEYADRVQQLTEARLKDKNI